MAFATPGSLVFDNTRFLGQKDNGALLHAQTCLYLGFASPSDWSIAHVASSLTVHHDLNTEHWQKYLDLFAMSREIAAKVTTGSASWAPHTHACFDIDFARPKLAPPETADMFEHTIHTVVRSAMNTFVRSYTKPLTLPTVGPSPETCQSLDSFFQWVLENASEARLFVVVRHLDRLFGRFLDAAMWEEYCDRAYQPTLLDRLDTIRRLVLIPIWQRLGPPVSKDSLVRKLLVTGPILIKPLVDAPEGVKAGRNLPPFKDLSTADSLHGLNELQIRTGFSLDKGLVPRTLLLEFLDLCNKTAHPSKGSALYTLESVSAVRPQIEAQLKQSQSMSPADRRKRICHQFISQQRHRVLRTLYPVLRRDAKFAELADGLLDGTATLDKGFGPIFSLSDLVSAATPEKTSRLFLTGLLAKVEKGDEVHYTLAGGCARALLQEAVDEAKKTRLNNGLKVDGISFEKIHIPEKELAMLILEFYRNVPPDRLPKSEAEFQADLAGILRTALEKHLRQAGFPSDVQLEVWLKEMKDNPGSPLIVNLRFDVAIRIRSTVPGQPDRLYIFELKYFRLDRTMDATHAKLEELNKSRAPGQPRKLVLDSCETKSAAIFWDELRSILPKTLTNGLKYWHVHPAGGSRNLRFDFSPDHIEAYYYDDEEPSKPDEKPQPRPKPPPKAPPRGSNPPQPGRVQKVKTATKVVGQAGNQATRYMATAVLGVGDECGYGQGFADARFTDLGEGETIIIAYSIVNIAGALVYVKCHGTKMLHRKIAIVNAYPWTKDPTKKEVDAILAAKKDVQKQKR
ncbi:hypothetical protein AURDEDRAFT_169227 [Auricularia subglabra TFB-10046 SS5]|nr:hypothetical protein AURDEDRAFT_169227 [Auricularia subglabra TFB-10046 SS5]